MVSSETAYHPSSDRTGYRIQIFVDDSNSWIVPWAKRLHKLLTTYHTVELIHNAKDFTQGDFAFLLGCVHRIPPALLKLHRLNLVVHESDLPRGRGFSPLAWQVVEGATRIPIVLFEAVEDVDAGPIYLRDHISLEGTELLSELRCKQGKMTIKLITQFLEQWPDIVPQPQCGTETRYFRRCEKNDELDISKTIDELFNQLRVVDNERYPAWFRRQGKKYIVKIYQAPISDEDQHHSLKDS